ncbi:hypothetical protein ACIA8K_27615 [Catenuloplanes sp. NPDC051500]|uniref:hypothetical protein n=1 Tax=Catenuloplanes sp. NPDC051500 TaxID=3363959 RepID=UPI0037BCA7ED
MDQPPAEPEHPVGRLLRSAWIQGVGAIAGVVAVGLTVVYAQRQTDEPPPAFQQSGTGNVGIHDGSNNCVNCQIQQAEPSPSAPLDPLAVNATWPTEHGCDSATSVAVFSDGPDPQTIRLVSGEDLRIRLTQEGGAVFGRGFLRFSLTVTDDSTVEIVNLRPVIFRRTTAQPMWIWAPEGGCGDSYNRVFRLDLDEPSLQDMGVQGTEEMRDTEEPPPADGELGATFHVTRDDPAMVEIRAEACAGTYEWGLDIVSVVRGEQRVTRLGTPNLPYRSIGALPSPAPAYGWDLGNLDAVTRTGERDVPHSCA